jgi:hypothetical protein
MRTRTVHKHLWLGVVAIILGAGFAHLQRAPERPESPVPRLRPIEAGRSVVTSGSSVAPEPARVSSDRSIVIRFRRTDGSRLREGEIVVAWGGRSTDSVHETVDLSGPFALDHPEGRGPPTLAILADGLAPGFVAPDDRRWELPDFEVELDPMVSAQFVVVDRENRPIGDALVTVHDAPVFVRTYRDMASFGIDSLEFPRSVVTDELGRARVTIPRSAERVFADVRAFGFREERMVECELDRISGEGAVTVTLAALLAAGVEIVLGRPDIENVERLGSLRSMQESGGTMRTCGPSAGYRSELTSFLESRMRPGRRIAWSFGFEPLDGGRVESFVARFRYILFPDVQDGGVREVNRYTGALTYRKLLELTDADVPVIDVAADLEERMATVEVEFAWAVDASELPEERGWIVNSMDDARVQYVAQRRPDFDAGVRHYSLLVGAGRYVLAARHDFSEPVPFEPVEFEVGPRETRRLSIPRSTTASGGQAVFRVFDREGCLVNQECLVKIRRRSVQHQLSMRRFVGEQEWRLAAGEFTAKIELTAGNVVSDSMHFTIEPGGTTLIDYYPTE